MHKGKVLSLASGGALSLATMLTVAPAQADDPMEPRGEIGLYVAIAPGIAGGLKNPTVQFSPGLALSGGSTIRYHLSAGYAYLNETHGVDIQPATIGIPILVTSSESMGFAIEPLLNIIGVELYFGGSGVSYLFETGIGLQGVLNFKSAFIAFAPLNLQLRIFKGGEVLGTEGAIGLGLNAPIRLSGGLRF